MTYNVTLCQVGHQTLTMLCYAMLYYTFILPQFTLLSISQCAGNKDTVPHIYHANSQAKLFKHRYLQMGDAQRIAL